MDISIQFKTIIFSILYGVFFSLMLSINYKYLIGNKYLSIIVSLLFVIVNVLIYFIILKKINYGIFHPYEILCIVIGFIVENLLSHLVYKKIKKWYTTYK